MKLMFVDNPAWDFFFVIAFQFKFQIFFLAVTVCETACQLQLTSSSYHFSSRVGEVNFFVPSFQPKPSSLAASKKASAFLFLLFGTFFDHKIHLQCRLFSDKQVYSSPNHKKFPYTKFPVPIHQKCDRIAIKKSKHANHSVSNL